MFVYNKMESYLGLREVKKINLGKLNYLVNNLKKSKNKCNN